MLTGIIILTIAGLVLTLAIAMKVVAKVSDSRPVFYLSVGGFLLIYTLAAIALSWLIPGVPKANLSSLSDLFQTSPPAADTSPNTTTPEEVLIRE